MIKCPICGQDRPVAPLTKDSLAKLPAQRLAGFINAQTKVMERERPYARHYSKTFNRARTRVRRAEEIRNRGKKPKEDK